MPARRHLTTQGHFRLHLTGRNGAGFFIRYPVSGLGPALRRNLTGGKISYGKSRKPTARRPKDRSHRRRRKQRETAQTQKQSIFHLYSPVPAPTASGHGAGVEIRAGE